MIVLGCDASWTGWGWALAGPEGPVATGHFPNLGGKAWRWSALNAALDELEPVLIEASLLAGERRPIVAVELAPPVYAGRGNQAATGQGIGQIIGAIQAWAERHPRLGYPWALPPATWRDWWGLRGCRGGRPGYKRAAIATCEARGWRAHLEPFSADGEDYGARGDVAEATLLAVGCANHPEAAPRGPSHPRRPNA